jgi:hypothetical protein
LSLPPLWTLILQRRSPKPVAEIGRLLAYHLSLHPTDAIALVRYGGGLVAENLPDEVADRLVTQLDAIGVKTHKIDAHQWGIVSPGIRAFALEFIEGAVLARVSGKEDLVIHGEDVVGFHVYALLPNLEQEVEEFEMGRRARNKRKAARSRSHASPLPWSPPAGECRPDGAGPDPSVLSPRGRALFEKLASQGQTRIEFHLTFYCTDPSGPIRISKSRFDYSCLGEQKKQHSLDNFLTLLDEVVARFPHAWNREAAQGFLRDLDPSKILYFKEEEAENFDRWMLQLTQIELAEKSGESGGAG